jgi:hypothetical protein
MLFMVIERFRDRDAAVIGQRLDSKGRMLPGGVAYHSSWIDEKAMRCFQLMEAEDESFLDAWISHWKDLVDFEVIPVVPSAQFWSKIGAP